MKIIHQGQNLYLTYSEINRRTKNEDSFLFWTLTPSPQQNPIPILAVADGMGGHAHGELVSHEALKKISLTLFEQIITSSINQPHPPELNLDQLTKAFLDSLKITNNHIKQLVNKNKWDKAGSTIIIAAILENQVIALNLGDSPLYHYQPTTQTLTKKNQDHTVTNILLQSGLISSELAPYHEGRNTLQYYIGCPNLPNPKPLYTFNISPGDILLLCSDGVSRALSESDLTTIFNKNQTNLQTLADHLIQAAKNQGEEDNQTLILWQYQGVNFNPQTPPDLFKTTQQFTTIYQTK